MKRKSPRLPGIMILAASLAGLVFACYFPRLPDVPDLYLDITENALRFHPPTAEAIATATITATLHPSVALRRARDVRWDWNISSRNVVDFFDSIAIEGNSSSTVTVIAWNSGEAYITVMVRVTPYGEGEPFEASRRITVSVIESHD